MIALDTNLLVYAHREDTPAHAAAVGLLEGLRRGRAPWAIPWPCVHEFIGVVTHPRIFQMPSPLGVAFAAVAAWQAGGNVTFLAESPGYLDKLAEIARAASITGPRIHDARIAALCLHHGVRELWTVDRDFSSFPQITARNPLVTGT